MPCPQVTVGFRQELPTTSIEVVFLPRRSLTDSKHQTGGWLSMRHHLPGSHHSRLAVTVINMYSSLVTTYHMRYVKYTYRWRNLSIGTLLSSRLQYIQNIAD